MPDDGGDLTFGSFITSASAAPQDVIELAQASERLALIWCAFSAKVPRRRLAAASGKIRTRSARSRR
jgi:hypothetical protein